MLLLPDGIISRFRVFRAKPAGIEPCFIFLPGIPSCTVSDALLFPVFQKRGMVKWTPPLLAEDHPFRIAGIAPIQIPDAAYRPLFTTMQFFMENPACLKHS